MLRFPLRSVSRGPPRVRLRGSLREVFPLCAKPLKPVTAIYSFSGCKARVPEVPVCDEWREVPTAKGWGAENGADVPVSVALGVRLACGTHAF